MEFVQAYALDRDREYVEMLQAATVKGDDFALESAHGLVGSSQWWNAIRAGTIATTRVEGEIVDIRVNAGNWPEFEVDSKGESSTWALEGDIKTYHVGSNVRVDYVTMRYANPRAIEDELAKIVTGIWVEG